MMKRLTIVAFLACMLAAEAAQAKFTKNPDDNTLWIEDGAAPIAFGPGASADYWQEKSLEFLPVEGGGFMIRKPNEQQYAICRLLPVDPAYPWFVMEISDAYPTIGYRGLGWSFGGGYGMNFGGAIKKGIYECRPFSQKPETKGPTYWRMDAHGWDVTCKYMKMVKSPEYLMEFLSPALDQKGSAGIGDTITIRLTMPEAADDVTVRLQNAGDYWLGPVRLNNEPLIQLYPTDEDQKVWEAKVVLKSGDPAKKFDPGQLTARFQILGASLTYPVFIVLPYTLDLTKPN